MATSGFYRGSQDQNQKPHIIFWRPGVVDAIEAINKFPKRYREMIMRHYQMGGSLMRDV